MSDFTVFLGPQLLGRARKGAPIVLLTWIEHVIGRGIKIATKPEYSDFAVLSALDIREAYGRAQRQSFRTKKFNLDFFYKEFTAGIPAVVYSNENLFHPWWMDFGQELLESNIPRLTFIPEEIDPRGSRLPYWWNYLAWPEFPRPNVEYRRYGRLYSLERLMEPVPRSSDRIDRACWVGSYEQSEPRKSMLSYAQDMFGLDTFGSVGNPVETNKLDILKRYKYSVGSENSLGFGYDSEKIPEIWDAGCVPVAAFKQPMSDFNPDVVGLNNLDSCNKFPLLTSRPDPRRVLDFLEKLVS